MILTQRGVLPPVQLAELATDVYQTGSFQLQPLAGWSVNPSNRTVLYVVIGNIVYWYISNGTTGTSNAVTHTWQNVPVALRPAATRFHHMAVTDNSVDCIGRIRILSDGTVALDRLVVSGTLLAYDSNWTAANNKGIGTFTLSYPIN
jgi:hypothetical protein